ncbi:MAG: hypothetical protein PHR00_04750 [Patescibacteria group bacterium]|nr:hypothetical protein [Patescibacteria group bacterium]
MNKKILKISFVAISLGALLISVPIMTSASGATASWGQELENPMNAESLTGILASVSKWVLALASPLAILMGIWAAVLFITAGGDPGKVKQGREALQWAVIGLAVVLLANSLVGIVQTKLGEADSNINSLINVVVNYLQLIGGPLAIIMFIMGAFLYATGNPKNITKANQIFLWTSVGLVLLLIATSIEGIIRYLLTP